MERFKIPRTAKGVTDELGEVGALLTATQWRRAALLASVVRLTGSGGNRGARAVNPATGVYTPEQFSELGIKGLTKGDTVRLYVQRWLDANDGAYPELGKTITLPDDDWPPTRTGTDGYESEDGVRRTIERIVERHGPDVVAGAIVDNEKLTTAVRRTELDRYVPMEDREGMARENRDMKSRFDATLREAKASGADHQPHDALYGLLQAEQGVRAALVATGAVPFRSERQAGEIRSSCQRIRRMLDLIEMPESQWSDEDREFLNLAGIGGPS